jgi:hypothetical protein
MYGGAFVGQTRISAFRPLCIGVQIPVTWVKDVLGLLLAAR